MSTRDSDATAPRLCGLVLAAGAGRRYGVPKALVRDSDGTPWLTRAVDALRQGGCDDVVVVLGAQAEEARKLVPDRTMIVPIEGWPEGMAASLRAGLSDPSCRAADAVVVMPVDTPDASPRALHRLVATSASRTRNALAQATYGGNPGHPVLLGRDHLDDIVRMLHGDAGAREYLVAHGVCEVECGDIWSGDDVDVPVGAGVPG
ncbi:MAG: nucleotidyltransferase family protein [Microthrixaceae bacterium]|nr:nucleotidyltransferase family protein [Microthrixaceae bacterium]